MAKKKKKTWEQLKETRCPKCNSVLMKDMFSGELLGCSCGFIIKEDVKNLLVNRDHNGNK